MRGHVPRSVGALAQNGDDLSETLPMVIYAMARRGVSPIVNAVSALIVTGFGVIIVISQRLQTR